MDLQTFNKQETFEVVIRHLMSQGKKSEIFTVDSKGEKIWDAAYRGRMRRKCSLGILIPDSNYYPGLEGQELRTSGDVLAAISNQYYKLEPDFLHKLQVIHDIKPEKDWAEALFNLAIKESLEFPQDLHHFLPKED